MTLDVLNDCVRRIPEQDVTARFLDQLFQTGSLLSSESFTGIERIRASLKTLGRRAGAVDVAVARKRYDQEVERLGRCMFALGRRLHQLENDMAACPFSEQGDDLKSVYGRTVRQQAGDIGFLRQELNRWVHRFVPLKSDLPQGDDVLQFIGGRIDAVVDELGLRLSEIRDVLFAIVYQQLLLFDPSLTRQQLYRRDLDNLLDVGHLLEWLNEVFTELTRYDQSRSQDSLERVKSLLNDFDMERFPALAGVRESEQVLFLRSLERFRQYEPINELTDGDDPVKVLLLLFGDLIGSLRRAQTT